MQDAQDHTVDDPRATLLRRSDALQEALLQILDGAAFDASPRGAAAYGMCAVALEHGISLRALMEMGLATSSAGLLRLQFEALTRAMWLHYAASDAAIEKISAPLTPQSELAAKNIASVSEMIEQMGKRVGTSVPAAAHQMLVQFKDVTWNAMNSFVHGGIHPLRRQSEGFPVHLALQVVRSSNGLLTMAGMMLSILTGDAIAAQAMRQIQPAFADCLPELLK